MRRACAVCFSIAAAFALSSCGARQPAAAPLPPATAISDEPATLATATGNLEGTLRLPAGRYPVPVVLVIAGSGPTDRDGNSRAIPGNGNSLRMLAEGLAERDVASLRYDKRGIAASAAAMTREEELRFDHLVDDAAAWVRRLRADPRFSTVSVAGHSEGSLIGMLAARAASADGFVSIAGAGRSPRELIREQLSAQLPDSMVMLADDLMRRIGAGERPDSIPPLLRALFRPSVQPYLASWFRFDPAQEIARLRVPTMIVQGTTDLQITEVDARRLAAAKPDAKLVVIAGMNHVMKAASGTIVEQLRSYGDGQIPVVPQVIDSVAAFVRAVPARAATRRGAAGADSAERLRLSDSMTGADKAKHFFISAFVQSVSFAGLQYAGATREASMAGATATTVVAGVWKEMRDARTSRIFSVPDLFWDAMGAGAATLVLLHTRR